MLIEHPCRQITGEFPRRWMSDEFMDLIVWLEPGGGFYGFQLCYDKTGNERALTWTTARGFSHHRVRSGDTSPNANCTPILVPAGELPFAMVEREFAQRSASLDSKVRELVAERLGEYKSRLAG